MTPLPPTLLAGRAIIALGGDDAASFLQGLVTANVANLGPGETIHTALLTPQGKVLSAFFVWRTDDGFLLDALATDEDALVRRLTLYKLRAKVEIGSQKGLAVFVGDAGPRQARDDPRLAGLGQRWLVAPGGKADGSAEGGSAEDGGYDVRRVALGVPEFGADYGPGEVFPMDVNLDALGAVDYKKGCFVGQEVASRMHRKGQVRKRSWRIEADAALTAGAAITAGASTLGSVTSVAGGRGIALVRTDRVAAAPTESQADGMPVTLSPPAYLA